MEVVPVSDEDAILMTNRGSWLENLQWSLRKRTFTVSRGFVQLILVTALLNVIVLVGWNGDSSAEPARVSSNVFPTQLLSEVSPRGLQGRSAKRVEGIDPPEGTHDGFFRPCENGDEMFDSLCYTSCARLTNGTYPIRSAPCSCCKSWPCVNTFDGIPKVIDHIVTDCTLFWKHSVKQPLALDPHNCNICNAGEEYFHGRCYKTCKNLTHGKFPVRTGSCHCHRSRAWRRKYPNKSRSNSRIHNCDKLSKDEYGNTPRLPETVSLSVCNPCLRGEEYFEDACYPACSSFFEGKWPIRVGRQTCCMEEPCEQWFLKSDEAFNRPSELIRKPQWRHEQPSKIEKAEKHIIHKVEGEVEKAAAPIVHKVEKKMGKVEDKVKQKWDHAIGKTSGDTEDDDSVDVNFGDDEYSSKEVDRENNAERDTQDRSESQADRSSDPKVADKKNVAKVHEKVKKNAATSVPDVSHGKGDESVEKKVAKTTEEDASHDELDDKISTKTKDEKETIEETLNRQSELVASDLAPVMATKLHSGPGLPLPKPLLLSA